VKPVLIKVKLPKVGSIAIVPILGPTKDILVCHTMALPFPLKTMLRQKYKIMETQIFHHAKI
jgi:hypothetical protein